MKPSEFMDWLSVKQLVDFLKKFFEMTLRISGSQYVTANSFLTEISDLFVVLHEWQNYGDASKRSMAFSMKSKFDKYWGDHQKMNLLIFIANILDPRDNLEYMEYQLTQMYEDSVGRSMFCNVKSTFVELFNDYSASVKPHTQACSKSGLSIAVSKPDAYESGKSMNLLKARFKKYKMELGIGRSKKTALKLYLSKSLIEEEGSFDILR